LVIALAIAMPDERVRVKSGSRLGRAAACITAGKRDLRVTFLICVADAQSENVGAQACRW